MVERPVNQELYDLLRTCADSTGLPVMDKSLFASSIDKYGKNVFRATLAEFITAESPPYPLKKFHVEKVIHKFRKLESMRIEDVVLFPCPGRIVEKYDDYKYSYDKFGLGIIGASSAYNDCSDYFMNDLRMECGSYGFDSPIRRWENGNNLWGAFGPIFRKVNTEQDLTRKTYTMSFRIGSYIATQFKPSVAKTVYDACHAKTVLDTSMGWGDRLVGFYASGATHYIGCDPNPHAVERYHKMIELYDRLYDRRNGEKTVQIYNCGAEDLPWDEIKNVDCAFTSPPYFSTERYNEGGDKEELQSWFRYKDYDSWRDDFFLPVAQKSFDSLSERGVLLVNIMDPKVHGKRYRTSDELVDMLRPNFLGQVGMRIKQRPKGANVFKDENGEFDKNALDTFMDKIYVENVWCFGKDMTTDLFADVRVNTLEDFFV